MNVNHPLEALEMNVSIDLCSHSFAPTTVIYTLRLKRWISYPHLEGTYNLLREKNTWIVLPRKCVKSVDGFLREKDL